MDLTSEFDNLMQEVTQLRGMLEDTRAQPLDDDMRAYLEQVIHALDQQLAEAQRTFPDAVREIDQVHAEATATKKDADRKFDALKAKEIAQEKAETLDTAAVVAATVGAAAALVPPPPALDPRLGENLRDELLSLYGIETAPAPPAEDPGSVWQFCSELGQESSATVSKPKPKTQPPKKKAKKTYPPKPGSEAWENLSELDDE